ncbi:MAG: hypothetical protein A3G49_04075 [Candidatus Sungbacteria bacterium RIFCSPLOWO2_12_FULL_41_11]|uniref:Uncharacterized protein n=1 Tax=Candidatus Sungbacteria bacterium RIFCSPLOWO2_12_FULL_41_11 TaxID=1802286 RepID=A0A1G2LT80_9BACT|nr:MAG: hypothetical protein UV01_C0010G0050 [Parcubacteria group bacterium GW2011_GWA2_42_14]OGZ99313.1 MAG: hypothetical protein A3D41_02545 [Candidatus Sungbacteria bacterium RIFCSPHIGHO2_02_FULL_41_12b]OHA14840.1 MAG: hypothetical protein A3G49_04075 [Candidatus Sungbacteria bacterium RIFCSPLOWO2_12_FULL_41_11]
MKLFLFSIIYLFSLVFEVGFISFLGITPLFSFWIFIICAYFFRKEDIFIFGTISSIFALVFFTVSSLYPLVILLGTVSALLIKSFQGLNKKTAFLSHALLAIIFFESARAFIFFPGHFFWRFWEEVAINGVFLASLLVIMIFYEIRVGFNKGYSI